MKRGMWMTAMFCAVLLAGCRSIDGTWRTISVVPEHAHAPFAHATFDEEAERYTATAEYAEGTRASSGRYEFDGRTLELWPDDGEPRAYDSHLRSDGMLRILERVEGEKIEVLMEKLDK